MIGGKWTGVEGAVKALVDISSECARDDVVVDAMLAVTRPIAEEMGRALYERIRRVTGATGESIEAQRVTDAGTPDGVVAIEIGPRTGSTAGFKVRFWEFGTSKLPARPFMRPTWDQHEGGFGAQVTGHLRNSYQKLKARFSRGSA